MERGFKPSAMQSLSTYVVPDKRNMMWLLFSLDGRASRSEYWKGSLVIALGALLVGVAIGFAFATASPFDDSGAMLSEESLLLVNERTISIVGVALVFCLPLLWSSIALGVKRWHDRAKSGAWMLVNLVPYIGSLWAFVECGFLPGTKGENAYGPDPLA